MPRQQVFLVTCLDPHVDPAAFLGVELEEAPVIRNAGSRVTEAVINDIAFISYVARTMIPDGPLFEVAVVHHTGCGTGFLADAAFRSAFATDTGLDEAVLAAEAVVDPVATVRRRGAAAVIAQTAADQRLGPRLRPPDRTGHHHRRPITATAGTEPVSRCAR